MLQTLQTSLTDLAQDEGKQSAITVAEQWRNTLEDMAEAASTEQRTHILPLMAVLNTWLTEN